MPESQVSPTDRDPHGWRAGAIRVGQNALLVLFAFEVVSLTIGTVQILVGATSLSILELLPVGAVFLLVRWVVVLPGLLLVLAGIEAVARRVPHARVLAFLVALTPMAWWQVTQSSGDTSWFTFILGMTAVLFAVLARLPDRSPAPATPERSSAETAVAPR